MRFRHSVSLTVDNFSGVFKLLLYRLISAAVFFSLTYVILSLGLSTIVKSAELNSLKDTVASFLKALFGGNYEVLQGMPQQFHAAVSDFLALLGAHIGSIVGSLIGVCCMYLLSRYFNGLAHFALGGTVNDRMSMNAKTRFSASYFRRIGQASLYQLVYVPLTFVYDVLSVGLCVFLFFYIPSLLTVYNLLTVLLSLSLSVALILVMQAFKLTFVSAWMPAMIAGGKKVGQALKETARCKKSFWRRFGAYLIAAYLIVVVNVTFGLCTLGSGLFISVPLSYFFLLVMQFVNYYTDSGKKYYVTRDRIAEGDGEAE